MPGFVLSRENGGDMGGNLRGQGASMEHNFYASFSWEIQNVQDLSSKLAVSPSGGPSINLGQEILLRTASLPQITFEKVASEGGTVNYKFAGNPAFEDIRISFYDTLKFGEIYRQWVDLMFTIEEGVKPPNSYKADSRIRKYLVDRDSANAQTSGTQIYQLFGSWPTSFKESELTYLEASIKSVELTLTYDYFTSETE